MVAEDNNGQDQAGIKDNPKKQLSKIDKKSSDVSRKLTKIDSDIIFNEKISDIKPWEKSLIHLDLLNQKFKALVEDTNTSLSENELIKTLQQINSQHKGIKLLFEDNALNGNLEAVKSCGHSLLQLTFYF